MRQKESARFVAVTTERAEATTLGGMTASFNQNYTTSAGRVKSMRCFCKAQRMLLMDEH